MLDDIEIEEVEAPNSSKINNNDSNEKSTDEVTNNQPSAQPQKTGRFQEGEQITFIRIRFPGNSKSFPFLVGDRNFRYGQKVVAMSDRGVDVGYINSLPYKIKFNKSMLPLKSINREATQDDIDEQIKNIRKEKEAEVLCNKIIDEMKIEMIITHVQMLQFGKKMVFYFNAPNRVDFRDLVKELVGKLKIRIELRQISVRDRAACVGAVGPCGQITCCSSFLKSYGGVNIKMAKNQNLALIPSKLNGVCGQIKCCIKYEDNVYTYKRDKLPRDNQLIQTRNGDRGKVRNLYILEESFVMMTEKGQIRKYRATQYDKTNRLPSEWKFPREFSSIVNETHNIIEFDATTLKPVSSSQAPQETDAEINLKSPMSNDSSKAELDSIRNDDNQKINAKPQKKSPHHNRNSNNQNRNKKNISTQADPKNLNSDNSKPTSKKFKPRNR